MIDRHAVSRDQVARMLGVVPSTITRWAKLGLIPTVVTVGGHHRYYKSDIERLARDLAKGRLSVGSRLRPRDGEQAMAPGRSAPQRRDATRLYPSRFPGGGGPRPPPLRSTT